MSIYSSYIEDCKPIDIPVAITETERKVLRELAQKVSAIASLPVQTERAKLWKAKNSLKPIRPLIQARPESGWLELVPEKDLVCSDILLRQFERHLRRTIFRGEHIHDDWPVTNYFNIPWTAEWSGYGFEQNIFRTEEKGSFNWDPPLKSVDDFSKLQFRKIKVYREQTEKKIQIANDIFGDILNVRVHGRLFVTVGLTSTLIMLRGIEQAMMDMYDNPAFLHNLMVFLRDAWMHEIKYYEKENLLTNNNGDDDWIAAGGVGAVDELGSKGSNKVSLKDTWGHCESQEFLGVGPEQFEEFVLPYQIPLMKEFGLINYGCCEPLDKKFDTLIKAVPNIRRFSVSPWCSREMAAEKLQNKYVYSCKPNPSYICEPEPNFDEAEKFIRETLKIAKGCCLEFVMKDTHTFHNDPMRITKWTQMAREVISENI